MTQKLVLTESIERFCRQIDQKSSAIQYGRRLNDFNQFLLEKYAISTDEFLASFKGSSTSRFDVYDVLSEYRISLRSSLQKNTIASRIMTVRHFLELNDVPISSTKWRLKVKPLKAEQADKTPLSKDDVRKIILGCQSHRLRTFVQTIAATGMRSNECLSILTKHVNLETGTIYLRKEHTKMKKARTVLLTQECVAQLKLWIEYRNRIRRLVDKNGNISYKRKPLLPDTLFFSTGRFDERYENPHDLYKVLSLDFANTLDRIGLRERRDVDNRHKITLHSFRSFVKTTISDLGYQDFSEYFIGHKHSTYWSKPYSEILKLFHTVESYLTYLDYSALDAKGADIETKLDQKDRELHDVRSQLAELSKKLYEAGILKKD
jgi:integrase